MREVLVDEKSTHLLMTQSESDYLDKNVRLGQGEWFGIHAAAFLIVAWNLFAINLARTPGKWWFWIPVAVWAAPLAVHATWLALAGRPRFVRTARPCFSREEDEQ